MSDPSPETEPLTPAVFHTLLALSRGGLHGYGVMKRVQEDSGLGMGPGTVYGTLHRLMEAGWVREGSEDDSDARRGRVFHLTAEGRSALEAEAARITRLAGMDEVRQLLPESPVEPGTAL
jgi:DNA-binding PadR family transcriptional regulator